MKWKELDVRLLFCIIYLCIIIIVCLSMTVCSDMSSMCSLCLDHASLLSWAKTRPRVICNTLITIIILLNFISTVHVDYKLPADPSSEAKRLQTMIKKINDKCNNTRSRLNTLQNVPGEPSSSSVDLRWYNSCAVHFLQLEFCDRPLMYNYSVCTGWNSVSLVPKPIPSFLVVCKAGPSEPGYKIKVGLKSV